jgi:AAA domain
MSGSELRLAVSGTYSSGKTTTSEALSIATGIPRTDALTAREITVNLFPGRRFQELSAGDLLALGLRRLEERIQSEAAQPAGFISDGSVLHEWIYGEARLQVGISPGAPWFDRAVKRIVGIPSRPFLRQYLTAYGIVVMARAKHQYDAFVHLPLEFEMNRDGHRPVSESYRRVSDEMLRAALDDLDIPCHIVGGTVGERVNQIIGLFDLPMVMDVEEAIRCARQRIRHSKEAVAERQLAHQSPRSVLTRARYAMRY